jgi:ABC-type Na+ efflux pump permease subunit
MVGLTSMYDPSSLARFQGAKYPIGYSGSDSPFRELLERSGRFTVYNMDLSPAVAALKERKLVAVIYIPDTPPGTGDPVKITLYTLQNDIQAAVINVQLKETFLAYEKELRTIRGGRLDILPITLDFPGSSRGSDFYEFIYGLLIPLLLFMPAIISGALIIDLITEEYQHRTLETLLSTPMSMAEVVWGKVLACLVLVPAQAGAWLFLLSLNRISIANIPEILLQAAAFSLVLILVGALTSLYYRERTAAQFIFSTAIVVLMLLVLAFPGNPLNVIALLAAGAAGLGQWFVLGEVILLCILLGAATQWAAGWAASRSLTE